MGHIQLWNRKTTVTGLTTKDETSETDECRKTYIGNSALLGNKVFFIRVNPIQLIGLLNKAKNISVVLQCSPINRIEVNRFRGSWATIALTNKQTNRYQYSIQILSWESSFTWSINFAMKINLLHLELSNQA